MHTSKTAIFTQNQYASRFIRGQQIAEKLNASVNMRPEDGVKNLLFVKCFPSDVEECLEKYTVWIDLVDSDSIFSTLVRYPSINVIAISLTAVDYVKARLPNRVVYLPEHHCNFDRYMIPHRPVSVVGFPGDAACFDLPVDQVTAALKEIGLEFRFAPVSPTTTRQDVVEFYKNIDIQLCFRGPRMIAGMPPELKNPLKIANAASFGIPTVSYPEVSYMREFPPFLSGTTLSDIIQHISRLKDMSSDLRHQLAEKASFYHIDNVVSMYRDVLGE